LDRDGVINADSPAYVKNWSEFHFIPGSLDAIRLLTQGGAAIVVVTNQSGINRGLFSRAVLEDTHRRMCDAVTRNGGKIWDIFFCPHRPDEGCGCRKPAPGLIQEALRWHAISLDRAWIVGDSARDIIAGKQAGCRYGALVRTGNGRAAVSDLAKEGYIVDIIKDSLLETARAISEIMMKKLLTR
jgi:D-glycero-D-manno-heptose 1,7-bisphosphate phosphatase